MAACSFIGLPWYVAATVISIAHIDSLKMESESSAPGEQPQFLGVRLVHSQQTTKTQKKTDCNLGVSLLLAISQYETQQNLVKLTLLSLVYISSISNIQRTKSDRHFGVCSHWSLHLPRSSTEGMKNIACCVFLIH